MSFGPVRARRKERTESELLQGAAESLGEHKVHEADFKSEPAAVRDEVLPAGVEEADGVDESGEEAGETAKQLENSDAARAFGVRPNFDHVGCVMC